VRQHFDNPYKYSEAGIKGMLGFLVDDIFVVFGDQVFQQSVGILMDTNCAPLLADLFYIHMKRNTGFKKKTTSHVLSTIHTDIYI
jgi:hypothetical protein